LGEGFRVRAKTTVLNIDEVYLISEQVNVSVNAKYDNYVYKNFT